MIALDTNILVRYLAEPDGDEGLIATHLLEEHLTAELPGFVSVIVLVELCWVLKRAYGVTIDQQRSIVSQLLDMPQLVVQQADQVQQALILQHPDLADSILHEIGQAEGCSHTMTFDKKFSRLDRVELAT
jgi:predicted nucleic-acid-binding protein